MAQLGFAIRALLVLCLAVFQSLAYSQHTSNVFECPVAKIRALDERVKSSCVHHESAGAREECIANAFAMRNEFAVRYQLLTTEISPDEKARWACIALVEQLDRGPAQCKKADVKPEESDNEVLYFFIQDREVAVCAPDEKFVFPCGAKLFFGVSGLSMWKFSNVANKKSIHNKIKELTGSEKLAKTHSARVTSIVKSRTVRAGSLAVGVGMLSWLGAEAAAHIEEKNAGVMALFEGACKRN